MRTRNYEGIKRETDKLAGGRIFKEMEKLRKENAPPYEAEKYQEGNVWIGKVTYGGSLKDKKKTREVKQQKMIRKQG